MQQTIERQMNSDLIEKYFNDECSGQELKKVLDWFQTSDGRKFLEQDFQRQKEQLDVSPDEPPFSAIQSEKIYRRIQRNKGNESRREYWYAVRVASILLVIAAVSFMVYWYVGAPEGSQKPRSAFITYATKPNQQMVLNLSDGSKIRLDENSTLKAPKHFSSRKRVVLLKGEAYFHVKPHGQLPFIIKAGGAVIKDLDTKFNVKVDTTAGNVQVAVIQGKVELKKAGKSNQTSAVLTHNHFGVLRVTDDQILIEQGGVKNYISWMNHHLTFKGETLAQISRQLGRIYDMKFRFKSAWLKEIQLTANLERSRLPRVLNIIARTLDIHYLMKGDHVLWKE
jgi:ferric-dicitrate binding protein FerR (iron transport regulator)